MPGKTRSCNATAYVRPVLIFNLFPLSHFWTNKRVARNCPDNIRFGPNILILRAFPQSRLNAHTTSGKHGSRTYTLKPELPFLRPECPLSYIQHFAKSTKLSLSIVANCKGQERSAWLFASLAAIRRLFEKTQIWVARASRPQFFLTRVANPPAGRRRHIANLIFGIRRI